MADSNLLPARVTSGGRILIPVAFRKALGIRPGDEVLLQLEEGAIRISSRQQALHRLQQRVMKVVPKDVSLADEIIRQRREETGSRAGRAVDSIHPAAR